jgi:hypothetical protein
VTIAAQATKIPHTPGRQEGIEATVWSTGDEMGWFQAEVITVQFSFGTVAHKMQTFNEFSWAPPSRVA